MLPRLEPTQVVVAAAASCLIGAVTLLFKFGMGKEEDAKCGSLLIIQKRFRKLSYTQGGGQARIKYVSI